MPDEDYAARVRATLSGQQAPPAPTGGRRVLFRCPACGRPWLQDGPRVELTLSGERLAALAVELAADPATLPYATCRICGAAHGIGELAIDEYGAGRGYGFSWEGVDPPGAHLLGSVLSEAYLLGVSVAPRAGVVTRPDICRGVLAWLATLKTPASYRPFTPADSAGMASDNPPGHLAPGTDGWVWHGVYFQDKCATLGGRVVLTLAQATPPGEPFSVSAMVATWRELARIMLAGNIAGETLEDESADNSESEG